MPLPLACPFWRVIGKAKSSYELIFNMKKYIHYFPLQYPDSFDVSTTLIENDLVTKSNIGKYDTHREYLYIIIDQILRAKNNYQIKINDFDDNVAFPVSSTILKDSVREYKVYLDYLEQTEFIWRCTEGEKGSCSTFKLCEPHNTSPISYYYYYKKKNVKSNKVFESLTGKINIDQDIVKKYHYQIDSYKNLSIDMKSAIKHIAELYPDNETERKMQELRLSILNNFECTDLKKLKTFFTDKQGKLYTPLSTLHNKLRKHMSLKVEMDISSSIPFHGLSFLFDNNEDSYINRKIKEICKGREEVLGKGVYEGIMLYKNGLDQKQDVKEYKELVCNGKLYSQLATIWNVDEKIAKLDFLTFCNMPSFLLVNNTKWNTFNYYFPNVAGAIENVNKNFIETKAQAKKNGDLDDRILCAYAIITQTLEAHFILDLVMQQVYDTDPTTPMISLHDAIYSTGEYSQLIINVIDNVYQQYYGFAPNIKTKKSCL